MLHNSAIASLARSYFYEICFVTYVNIWKKDQVMTRARDYFLLREQQINWHNTKENDVLTFPSTLAKMFPTRELYNWDERANWSIGEAAFRYINNHDELKSIQVFCHPRLLREYPTMIAYYRRVAALSQKSMEYVVGIDIKKFEADKNNTTLLKTQDAFALVRLLNEHITLIVNSPIERFSSEKLHTLVFTRTKAQIDEARRNAIEEEARTAIQRLLVKEAAKRDLLFALIPRVGVPMELYDSINLEEKLFHIRRYRGIELNTQTSILFSSEPDITLVGKNGSTKGVIEVKGGTDPAGALERYGAAKKSFENTRKDAPEAKTILIASCITNEARERISHDKTIDNFFNLTQVIKEQEKYAEFLELVFSTLGEASS